MVTIEGLSSVEERVLEALATYRYLTPKQMTELGVSGDKRHLYVVLGRLQTKTKTPDRKEKRIPKEIGELDFGAVPGKGRLARVYFLTKLGADLLMRARKDLEDVPYVKRPNKFQNEYWHHLYTVDFHIHVRAFTELEGHEVRMFKAYFEFAKRYTRATSIRLRKGVIIPDALCVIDGADGLERILAYEMANGSDTGRIEKQIRRYLEALDERAIEKAVRVGKDTPLRVLFVFEHLRTFENLRKRFTNDEHLEFWDDYIFCKALDAFEDAAQFRQGWMHLHSAIKTPLFGAP